MRALKSSLPTWLRISRGPNSLAGAIAGTMICAFAALTATAVAAGHSWQIWVPLAFSVLLPLIALWFGSRAGVLGTVVAAVIFAVLLFSPVGSVRVTSAAARSNLGWMLLIGIAFSLLFAPQSSGLPRQ